MVRNVYFATLVLLSFLACHQIVASSNHHHDQDHSSRTLNFTLYQHETINKTGYIVVDGVAGAGISRTTTPFGTIYVFRDSMTVHADTSSRLVGIAEGSSITTSFDGLRSLSLAKITLDHKGHRGSVSILGGTYNTKPSDYPIVGGTGDFLYVQGYVRSSPVDLQGVTVTYKTDFHFYWPPYAPYAPK